jgi:hypothetical protein
VDNPDYTATVREDFDRIASLPEEEGDQEGGDKAAKDPSPFALCPCFGEGVLGADLAVFYSITTGRENGIPARTTVDDVFPVAPIEEVVARTAKDLVLPVLSLETVNAGATIEGVVAHLSIKVVVRLAALHEVVAEAAGHAAARATPLRPVSAVHLVVPVFSEHVVRTT